jgi:hypothetical protein
MKFAVGLGSFYTYMSEARERARTHSKGLVADDPLGPYSQLHTSNRVANA